MARATPTVQQITDAGVVITAAIPTVDGDKFPGDARTFVKVINAHATLPTTVTIQTGKVVAGHTVSEQAVTVASGVTKYIGPFSKDLYNQPSGADKGMVYVDYSLLTDITRSVIRL